MVGTDYYRVILITPDLELSGEYSISEEALNTKIDAFRASLEDEIVHRDIRPQAQELYQILVGPVAQDLSRLRVRTLLWELDGKLRYVPIAALHDGRQYLVERYQNVVITPASPLDLTDAPPGHWRAAGFGVSQPSKKWRLPALDEVPAELCSVIQSPSDHGNCPSGSASGILQGEWKLNGGFTSQALVDSLRGGYQVVHIASHFVLDSQNVDDSYLLIGDERKLTVSEMSNYDFDVELLTLSACNTAIGPNGSGKELESLATMVEKNGAKAVLATLWPVADVSTEQLMIEFYRERESGKSKAEALQQAQLSLLHDAHHPQPYYWAPFVLIGNPQ